MSELSIINISIDLVVENAGVSRLFNEVGAYFDNVAQKLQISKQPKNKVSCNQVTNWSGRGCIEEENLMTWALI